MSVDDGERGVTKEGTRRDMLGDGDTGVGREKINTGSLETS